MTEPECNLLETARALADRVLSCSPGEAALTHVALAACVRNRLSARGGVYGADAKSEAPPSRRHEGTGSGCGNYAEICDSQADTMLRALANICLLLCDGIADPTNGAIQFHRHDRWPDWALHRTPVALIGAYVFYDDADLLGVPLDLEQKLP